jgi:hypothetical protein
MKKLQVSIVFLAGFAAVLMHPLTVHAQAATLGDMFNNASDNTYNYPTLVLSVVTFVAGAALAMWSMIKFKQYADGQVNISDPMWRLLGGSLLMALPFMVQTVLSSMGFDGEYGDEDSYDDALTKVSNGNCNNGLDQCMVILVKNIYGPVETFINVACWLLGGICIAIGIYRLAQSGQMSQGAAPRARGTIGYLGGGGLLISLGEFMDTVRDSLFGGGQTQIFNALSYGNNTLPQNLQTTANGVFMALFAWMQLLGWLAFARGVYLLVKLSQGEGQKSHGQAFTHIIGGALAVNMFGLINVVQTTLGINLGTGTTP